MKKSYCYHVRDSTNGNKLVGGMLHAADMEDAAQRAVKVQTGNEETIRRNFV